MDLPGSDWSCGLRSVNDDANAAAGWDSGDNRGKVGGDERREGEIHEKTREATDGGRIHGDAPWDIAGEVTGVADEVLQEGREGGMRDCARARDLRVSFFAFHMRSCV